MLRDRMHKSASLATLRRRRISRSASGSATAASRTARSTSCASTTGRSRRWKFDNLHDGTVACRRAGRSARRHRDALASVLLLGDRRAERASCAQQLREARQQLVEAEEPMQEVPVMGELPEPRPTYILARGAYDAPKTDANRVERDTFADMLIPFPADAPRNRLGSGPVADRSAASAHGPRVRESAVGQLLRPRPGRDAGEFRPAGRGADASRSCSIGWPATSSTTAGTSSGCAAQIVLSATYRQDSRLRPELRERDPENLLLARGPSRRLVGRADSRPGAGRVGPARSHDRRAARVAVPAGRRLVARDEHDVAGVPAVDRQGACIAARCTRCGSGRRRCRTCWRSTRTTREVCTVLAAARTRRCRRWCC